jgi:AAA domain-containing protein
MSDRMGDRVDRRAKDSGNASDVDMREIGTAPPTEYRDGEDNYSRPFPLALLDRPRAERMTYFYAYTVNHTALTIASQEVARAVYDPGQATTINVIGPTGVGKTTLATWLRQRLIADAKEHLATDPGHVPCVCIDATAPTTGRFDWVDYYRAVLIALGDPFASGRAYIRTRDLRAAMERALRLRTTTAILVDEAQHLAKVASGRKLQDQLDRLKYLGQYTGVVHVLLGTYELRAFRTVNAQLGRRSLDVHFPRYDATQANDRVVFRSTLWSFQRNLPLIVEPELKDTEWEYLYTRTIGCVGTLKQWLARALDRAIHEGAPTLTHAHLQATAPASARVEAAFQEAIEGEAEMRERADADSYLFDLVGLTQRRGTSAPLKSITAGPGGLGRTDTVAGSDARQGHPARPMRRPFVRKPQRDPIGPPNASSAKGEAS